MRCLQWISIILLLVVAGCSPKPATKSEEEIAIGDEKLAEVDEMRRVGEATEGDYGKMTEVDPKLQQEAMAALDKAIQDDPKNAEAYYARGFASLTHGEGLLKAIADFNTAIELNPKYARAFLMRGRAYERLGEQNKAKSDRARALELQPDID